MDFALGMTGDGEVESESRTNRAMEKRNPLLGDKDLNLTRSLAQSNGGGSGIDSASSVWLLLPGTMHFRHFLNSSIVLGSQSVYFRLGSVARCLCTVSFFCENELVCK
jgi:hypothetical protein